MDREGSRDLSRVSHGQGQSQLLEGLLHRARHDVRQPSQELTAAAPGTLTTMTTAAAAARNRPAHDPTKVEVDPAKVKVTGSPQLAQ
ncbi:hypothetical protein ACOMHN_028535 [Nucella lapillus]